MPDAIDYATRPTPRLPDVRMFSIVVRASLIAAGIGIGCVAGAWVTKWSIFVLAGALWTLVGGGATLGAFVGGAIYSARAKAAGYRPPHTRCRAQLATVLPMLNVPLAIACIVLGAIAWDRMPIGTLRLTMTNVSASPIGEVTLVFADGSTRSLGTVAGGKTIARALSMPAEGGVDADVRRSDGVNWRQRVSPTRDRDDFGGVPVEDDVTLAPPTP